MAGPRSHGVDNDDSSPSWAKLIAIALLLLLLILLGMAAIFFPPANATALFMHSLPALCVAEEALVITTAVATVGVTMGVGGAYHYYQGFRDTTELLNTEKLAKEATENRLTGAERARAEAEQARVTAERAKADAERARAIADSDKVTAEDATATAQKAELELLQKEYLRLADESLDQKKTILAMQRLLAKLELEAGNVHENLNGILRSKEKGSGKLHVAVLSSVETMLVPKKMQAYDQDLQAHRNQVSRSIEVEARAIRATLETRLRDARTHAERVGLLQHKIKHRQGVVDKLAPTLREAPKLFAEAYAYIRLHETYAVLAATDKRQVRAQLRKQDCEPFDFSKLRELLLGERQLAHQLSTPAKRLLYRGRSVHDINTPAARGRSSSVVGALGSPVHGAAKSRRGAVDDSVLASPSPGQPAGRVTSWQRELGAAGKDTLSRTLFGGGASSPGRRSR